MKGAVASADRAAYARALAAVEALPELMRNRVLRRVDWRFLLKRPQPRSTVCLAGGQLGEAAVAVLGASTDCDERCEAGNELAVATNPDRATLDALWSALVPGGECYTEWSLPGLATRATIVGRLHAAGFRSVRCYAPWPWIHRAWLWVPLDDPGAFRFFLQALPVHHGLIYRVGRIGRLVIWSLCRRLKLGVPLCVVAEKPCSPATDQDEPAPGSASHAASDPLPDEVGRLIRGLSDSESRELIRGPLSSLLLTGGYFSANKVVAFVLPKGSPRPEMIVKMARRPGSTDGLMREARILRAVERLRPGGVDGVPRVLACDADSGLAVIETMIDGVSLASRARRNELREHALAAADWLAALVDPVRQRTSEQRLDQLMEPTIRTFSERYGPALNPRHVDETRAILRSVGPLPVACEQRDFGPWNVLLRPDGSFGVLDWEGGEIEGLPGLDLVYFLTHLVFFVDGVIKSGQISSSYRRSYRASLDPRTSTGRVVREAERRYASLVGIDPGIFHALRLVTWLPHACSQWERMDRIDGRMPDPDALRENRYFRLWEEQLLAGRGR